MTQDKKFAHSAELRVGSTQVELPVKQGTLGEDVIDIATLGKHGYFTLDAGFLSTASCESAITFIDGQQGILLHRGYPIEQLAQHSNYLELCYLLTDGELPDAKQMAQFEQKIVGHTMVNEQVHRFFNGFRRDAHPMSVLCGVVAALSAFYHDYLDINDPEHRQKYAYRAIAKMPTLVAMCYKYYTAQPFMYPLNRLGYVENFLHMMFGIPCEERTFHPEVIRALDVIFMLHADHEQNASTSTVRMAGSTGANPFVCMSAGIAALWGPSHGGANEAVVNMLGQIGDVKNIDQYVAKAKDKDDPFLLMGFGHRVYKNFDPRASVLKEIAERVLKVLNVTDPSLEIAHRLEEIALSDSYFIERKLYPNVDFYSGIILKAMGFPTHMFTALFALARTVGWISHWKEMFEDNSRIARPRQLYTGAAKRDYPHK